MCVCSAVCHSADSSSVTRQHSFTAPPSSHQPPFASSSAAAVLDMSDRLIWQGMCVRRHRACALMCVCTAMSDRWCAYVVMSRAALQPFSPVPWEGFRWRHSSLNHPHSSSWSSAVSPSPLQAPIHPEKKRQMSRLHRSLDADLFIGIHTSVPRMCHVDCCGFSFDMSCFVFNSILVCILMLLQVFYICFLEFFFLVRPFSCNWPH